MRRGFADCGSRTRNNYAHALATSGADKKQGSADLLAKERHAASETQRDFAALKKSVKSDFAAKAASGADKKYNTCDFSAEVTSGADVKFCANVLVASGKFCERDFTAQGASKKSHATDLSAQSAGEKFCENEQSADFDEGNLAVFDQTKRWLDLYFSGREPGFTPALNPAGSAFRRAVWEILLKIPYGKTTTYGQIAREIAAARGLAKMSAQAVGHNEISIIIPCHRVVGTHGSLTGYAGGIDRKIKLLQPGGVDMRGLFTPAKSTAAQSGKFKRPQKILMLARKSATKFEYLNLDAAQRIACKSKASGDFKRLHRAQDGDH